MPGGVDWAVKRRKGDDMMPEQPQPVRLTNMKPSAEALLNKLKRLEANTRPNLKEDQDLAVELHTLSGAVIRIGEIGSYLDTDDALLVKGMDTLSGDPCAAIVPVQNFYVVFRVTTVEDPAQRQPIGFRTIEDPEQGTL
jgi:hypothetical protein